MTRSRSPIQTLACAIQRALLVLVPRTIRGKYRQEMIATFETACHDVGQHGSLAVCALLVREIGDLLTARRASPHLESAPARREWIQPAAWRQAWRSLARRPAFLVSAVLTLAFGAAVTTAVFSLVDTVLIKPLPYPDPDRLVTIFESSPSAREKTSLIAPGRLEDWHRLNQSFVALSGSYSENVTDTSGAEPERLEGRRVAPRFFIVHAMPPLAGRYFSAEEELATGPAAAIISEGLWTRRFQRDPQTIGRALTIGGAPFPIVGVMPSRFTNSAVDVWLPAKINSYLLGLRNARFVSGIGRLKAGVSVEAGGHELASIQNALGKEFPKTDAGWSAEVRPLKDTRIGDASRGLVLVFGAVASLWAIAVANIAGLTLVQVQRRAREMAVRAALGASRARVIGTVIREGLLIAFLGGALGAALATWAVSVMPSILTRTPRINELAFDWRALTFVAATSLVAACVFSLVPAFMGTRPQLNRTIATGSRGVAGGHHRLQRLLVVGQVALSMLLVGLATLLLRSYYNLTKVETGFDASDVVTFQVGARWDEDRARVGQLQEQLVSNLEQLPHVQAAGLTSFLPAAGATLRYQVKVDGLPGTNEDGSLTAGTRTISAGYLRAIRARLVAGSWCPPLTANTKAPMSAIVNQSFIDVYAPGQNLVGRSLSVMPFSSSSYTIAGIIGNLAEDGHAASPGPVRLYLQSCG